MDLETTTTPPKKNGKIDGGPAIMSPTDIINKEIPHPGADHVAAANDVIDVAHANAPLPTRIARRIERNHVAAWAVAGAKTVVAATVLVTIGKAALDRVRR